MANLGTLWFDTRLKNTAVQDAKRIREKLQSTLGANTKIAFDVNRNALRSNLKQALSNIHPKVKIDVVVNKTSATQAIKQAVAAAQQSDVTTRATNSQTVATQRLAKAQVAAANATNAHSRSMVKLNASFGQGISFSSKLGSTIAGIYSVAMLGRFGAQMIEIGGEFQKQRIALENMLGSLSKADALYARMKGLAVESPFTFKDLMGFTKQLRAFQIPYEEIFDTTKRLADISAGLGVDMNRIILAYGQVRSAAFLRGQEVRQFTEAGIPLLDALAKKFTELEGKVVSVGDVFEKISKRQVSFQMVKDVLWDLTDAGGQFYNMQAKLTESLSGKLDKLRDSYEIAIAEMAQGNNKALGTLLDTFTALAGHLGTVIGLVSSLTGAWLTYRAAMAAVNTLDMARGFAESIRHIIAMRRELGLLKAAQIEFNIAASANVWAGILSGVVLAVGAFMTLSGATKSAEERLREINGDLEEGTTLIKEKSSATQQSIKVLTDETKSEEERLRAYKEINRMYPGLLGNMDFEQAKRANSITLLNAETVATKALLREKLKLQGQRLQEEIADLEKGYDRGKGYSFLGFFHRNEKWQEKQLGDIINAKKALEENQKALEELGKTSEKVAVSNERWRKNANDMAKGFANLTPTSEEDYAQYLDRIKKEYDSVNSELKKRTSSAPDYQSLLNEQKALGNIYFKALGGAEEGLKGGGSSSRTDNQLEDLKHRVALYKKFFAEFDKARAMYGREGALTLMKNMGFGEVFGWGLDDVTNYSISLRKLTQGLSATTEARKNFLNTTDADIVAQGIKEEGEELRQYAEQLDMVLDKMRDGYDTYKRWYELTGNKELAASIAGVSMDRDYAGYLRDEMRKSMARAGINEDVDKVLGWDKAKVEDEFGKNSIIMKFWNEWQANNKKIRESNLALFEEAIKDAKRYEDKVADVNNELERQLTAIDSMTGISDAEKERLKSNRRANAQEQLSKLSWENFKKANDWGRVFGDLGNMSLPTIRKMITAMKEYGDAANLSVEDTKAWNEAMQKLLDRKIVLESLKTLRDIAVELSNLPTEKGILMGNIETLERAVKEAEDKYDADETEDNLIALEKAREALNKENAKYNTLLDREQELVNLMSKAVQELGSSISQLGSDLSQLGSDIGGKTGDILNGFGGMLGSLGKGISALGNEKARMGGFQGALGKASVVAGVASAMIQMNKSLARMLPSVDKLYEKHAEEVRELSEISKSIASIELSRAKRDAAEKKRGANGLSGLVYDAGVQGKAISSYFNTANSAQAIYKNKQAGWKKTIAPVAGAIAGIVAGIFTFGAGSALGAAVGTALGSALGGVLSATTTAVASTIIASGIGAAIGQGIASGVSSVVYNAGETAAVDNLRIETRKKKFFKDQKTQDLASWVRENLNEELFDKETGLLNIDVAEQVLNDYGKKLVGETKETLEELLKLSKEAQEYLDSVGEYVGDRFSSVADAMTDALWNWLSDGEDVMDSFYEYARDTFRNVAKDVMKNFLQQTILEDYMKNLKQSFAAYGILRQEGKADADKMLVDRVTQLTDEMISDYESEVPVAQALLAYMDEAFKRIGIDISNADSSSSSTSGSIKSITESTADLLASYINAIRADVSVNRGELSVYLPSFNELLGQGNVIAEAQVQLQTQIASNTLRNAEAAEAIRQAMHRIETGDTKLRIA